MRILLIATNMHRRLMGRMNAQPVPIGLAYIAGYLDPIRHDLKVLDLMFSEDHLQDTETTVREFQPDLIGISLRNLDNSSYMDPQWALPTTKDVIQRIRTITSSPMVCGGPGFSLLPEECFRFLEPDLGVAGDGGETFAQVADAIESGEAYHNLPGLVYNADGGQLVYKGLAYSSFSKPPRLEELDMPRYERAGFGIGIVTKLDDSFSYSVGVDNGDQTWRVLKPIEDVLQEIREMKKQFGLRKVFFIDSAFNVPVPHAKALCQALIDADMEVHWSSNLAPVPAACDEEVLDLMKRAGSRLIIINGVSGQTLEEDSLQDRLEPLKEVCQSCENAGLHYVISQYFGEPGETAETVELKLKFLHEINPALANLRVGVRIRPGTPVAQAALQEGLITGDSDLIRPIFYLDSSVREWIVDRLKSEADTNPRWNLL